MGCIVKGFGILLFLTAMGLVGCAGFGWVNNVVRLCKADFEHPYKAEVLRGIGVPAVPLGAVLGWCTFNEEK